MATTAKGIVPDPKAQDQVTSESPKERQPPLCSEGWVSVSGRVVAGPPNGGGFAASLSHSHRRSPCRTR